MKDPVQRIKRHQHDCGGAIGIRDCPAMAAHIFRVDFWNHQWHLGVHSERRRFVDRNRVRLARDRDILFGNIAIRAEKRDVDFVERSVGEFLYGNRFTAKPNRFPSRARRGEGTQICHGKISPFEYAQQLSARSASRAYDGDVIISHAHVDCNLRVTLCKRALASPAVSFTTSVAYGKLE